MRMHYQYLLAACLAAPAAHAQQVLLHTEVARDTLLPRTGPNRRYFGHLYLGYGLVQGGSGAGLPLRYGLASSEVQLGGRRGRHRGSRCGTGARRGDPRRHADRRRIGSAAPPSVDRDP